MTAAGHRRLILVLGLDELEESEALVSVGAKWAVSVRGRLEEGAKEMVRTMMEMTAVSEGARGHQWLTRSVGGRDADQPAGPRLWRNCWTSSSEYAGKWLIRSMRCLYRRVYSLACSRASTGIATC